MQLRRGSLVFGLLVGLAVATWSYQWVVDHEERSRRAEEEEAVVLAARDVLHEVIDAGPLEIVDPLAPNRSVGKTYVYPEGAGWAVSGYYRRDDADRWHPFLLTLTEAAGFRHLKVQDEALAERAAADAAIEIS